MSDWHDLASLGVTLRPLSHPPVEVVGRSSPFSASMTTTVEQLSTELRALEAKAVVLELDLRDRDLRVDGLPRSDAKVRESPAVRVSFESKYGPLRYATAEFRRWQENLRAIALSMEALRKVDRYGVSRRGEQYVGWRALPQSTDPAANVVTEDQAWRAVCEAAGVPPDSSPLLNGISRQAAMRLALRATHPDRGGDPDQFRRVMRAKEILGL